MIIIRITGNPSEFRFDSVESDDNRVLQRKLTGRTGSGQQTGKEIGGAYEVSECI